MLKWLYNEPMRFWIVPLLVVLGIAVLVLPAPTVLSGPPVENVALDQKIEVTFSRPIKRRLLEKSISPDAPGVWVFEAPLVRNHLYRKAVFYPSRSLQPDTEYTLHFANITGAVRQTPQTEETLTFRTIAVPEVVAVEPTAEAITVKFSRPLDAQSEFYFRLQPAAQLKVERLADQREVRLVPITPLRSETNYTLNITRSNVVWDLEENLVVSRSPEAPVWESTFRTNGHEGAAEKSASPAQIVSAFPANNWVGVDPNTTVRLEFSADTNMTAAATSFAFSPNIDGDLSWEGTTLFFKPTQPLAASTEYVFSVPLADFESKFTTQEEVVRLAVPAYLQQHTLSCEVSALRMTLAYRNIMVSEETLLEQVGVDPTPHKGNVWGNPNKAFVGNVDGRQMIDGYGVYWDPIARVASQSRRAEAFRNGDVPTLTSQIKDGNPVIIWVYSRSGRPTTWFTPEGEEIFAVSGEHSVVVVGFVGPASNPRELIINDPLAGQVYWPRSTFDHKWATFSNSGVVVY